MRNLRDALPLWCPGKRGRGWKQTSGLERFRGSGGAGRWAGTTMYLVSFLTIIQVGALAVRSFLLSF